MSDLNLALAELGRGMGIGELQLDDLGACRLRFDSGLELQITVDPADSSRFVTAVDIGPLPEDAEDDFPLRVLQANWYWNGTDGGTLALNPDGETLTLFHRHAVTTSAAELSGAIRRVMTVADRWAVELGELESADSEAAEPAAAPTGAFRV